MAIVGNPPYNDTTSLIGRRLKKSSGCSMDEDVRTRDLGLSSLLAYDKLQAIYPNLFALTRPNWKAKSADELAAPSQAQQKERSALTLFSDFFRDATEGDELSDEQRQVVAECLDEMECERREQP